LAASSNRVVTSRLSGTQGFERSAKGVQLLLSVVERLGVELDRLDHTFLHFLWWPHVPGSEQPGAEHITATPGVACCRDGLARSRLDVVDEIVTRDNALRADP
jgi:hypothetical protein